LDSAKIATSIIDSLQRCVYQVQIVAEAFSSSFCITGCDRDVTAIDRKPKARSCCCVS